MSSLASVSTSPRVLTSSRTAVEVSHATTLTSPPKFCCRNSSCVPLQRLECVRVAKKLRRNGHRFYVAAVFLQRSVARRRLSECVYKASPASKLSPQAMRDFMMTEREPDFVVERHFSEFRQLRDDVVVLARSNGAHVKACTECQELLYVVLSLKHRNWTLKRMFGNKEQRFALLTTFMNDLLMLMVGPSERTTSGSMTDEMNQDCRVREQVAELLQEFLKPCYQPSLGII